MMYNVEIAKAENYCEVIWDGDCFEDPIEADSAEEAEELAKDWLNEHGANADEYIFRVTEC